MTHSERKEINKQAFEIVLVIIKQLIEARSSVKTVKLLGSNIHGDLDTCMMPKHCLADSRKGQMSLYSGGIGMFPHDPSILASLMVGQTLCASC